MVYGWMNGWVDEWMDVHRKAKEANIKSQMRPLTYICDQKSTFLKI